MNYSFNSTKDYHVNQINSLGWELTVCNALYPENTPLRQVLKRNDSYGHLLYDYLSQSLPMGMVKNILEIGGGYGYLMNDFLGRNRLLKPCMLDISPYLLEKQKMTLGGYEVSFREEDFLETDQTFLSGFDLVIMNENLGDFPTLSNLNCDIFQQSTIAQDPYLKKVLYYFDKYNLDLPQGDRFNFNIGAIEALEKLCAAGVPYAYLGEHSCEAFAPELLRSIISVESSGNPEKISLMGHDEFTIKFSYLEQVARALAYKCIRGPFADFITFDVTEKLRLIMASHGQFSDEDEMICQFIEDLYKYEYLLLIKERDQY